MSQLIERTIEEYDYFCKRVRKWRDYFGLYDWAVVTRFEDIGENRSAEVDRYTDGGFAAMTLNTRNLVQRPEEGDYRLCKTAFHEVAHLMLAELAQAATTGIGHERAEPMEERVIRRLESTVHDDLLRLAQLEEENANLKEQLREMQKEA